jgi:hypothetical protein
MPDLFVVNGRLKQIEVLRRQQATRKAEVAAIVPYLMQIRAQAHFRFDRMERFRTAFHAACKEVERHGRDVLPLAFSYEEGTASSKRLPRQRLHLRLWDRGTYLEAPLRVGSHASRLLVVNGGRGPQARTHTAMVLLMGGAVTLGPQQSHRSNHRTCRSPGLAENKPGHRRTGGNDRYDVNRRSSIESLEGLDNT